MVLNPSLAILDETDSGLDVDAFKIVADAVNSTRSKDNSMLIICLLYTSDAADEP